MNISRRRPVAALVIVPILIPLAVTLAACGSTTESRSQSASVGSGAGSATGSSDVPWPSVSMPPEETTPAAAPCPTAPQLEASPQWTLQGATGSVAVTGPTETAAPEITVQAPFSVAETQVHTLTAGDGPVVSDTAMVSVCYMGVDGRTGAVFDSSYQRGAPAGFHLDAVVPGFQKAIAGQKVGSTVAVAMTSADGYPEGEPRAGIQAGDTLIFAIKILDASG